jgi:hypothetical protein
MGDPVLRNQSVRALGRYLTKVIFKMLIENRAYEIRFI